MAGNRSEAGTSATGHASAACPVIPVAVGQQPTPMVPQATDIDFYRGGVRGFEPGKAFSITEPDGENMKNVSKNKQGSIEAASHDMSEDPRRSSAESGNKRSVEREKPSISMAGFGNFVFRVEIQEVVVNYDDTVSNDERQRSFILHP